MHANLPDVKFNNSSNNVSGSPFGIPFTSNALFLATASAIIGSRYASTTRICSDVASPAISNKGQIHPKREREATWLMAVLYAAVNMSAPSGEAGAGKGDGAVEGYGSGAARLSTQEPKRKEVAESTVKRPARSWGRYKILG